MAKFFWPLTPISVVGGATEVTALLQLAELQDINTNTSGLTDVSTATKQDAQTALLTDIETNTADAATETTLAALNAKVTAVNTGAVVVSSSALPSGAATEATLAALAAEDFATQTTLAVLNAKSAGSLVPSAHDYILTTYVGATTSIDTVTYKSGGAGGTTVAVLTMSYDGSNRLSTVTKS